MTSENSVSFKVFLVLPESEPEIRRFSVPKDVVTSYMYLKQKLEMIFPSLKNNPFVISWRDREGDQVQIWSDEELIIALTEMDVDNKKLYVMPAGYTDHPPAGGDSRHMISPKFPEAFIFQPYHIPHSPPDTQNSQAVHHPGVTCDACEKGVMGFRYKCAFCPDFDLCQDCEAKKIHSEHYMVRIPTPIHKNAEFGKKMMREFFKFNRQAMKSDREYKRGWIGHGFDRHHHKHGGAASTERCPFYNSAQQFCGNASQPEQSNPSNLRSFFDQGLPNNVENIIESVVQGLMRMAGADGTENLSKETSSTQQVPTTSASNAEAQSQNQTKTEGVQFANTSTVIQESSHLPPSFQSNGGNTKDANNGSGDVAMPLAPQPSVSKPSTAETMQETAANSWVLVNNSKTSGCEPPQTSNTESNPYLKAAGDLKSMIQPLASQFQQHMTLFTPVQQQSSNPSLSGSHCYDWYSEDSSNFIEVKKKDLHKCDHYFPISPCFHPRNPRSSKNRGITKSNVKYGL